MQKLIFPFRRGMIIAGYKTAIYKKSWGYDHYGIDISSRQGYDATGVAKNDHVIYASGEGEVVWCQYDTAVKNTAKTLGYAIAILYKDCVAHDGTVKDLVLRYMHSDTTFVKKGDKVHLGDPITVENKVGTTDYHLHLEMDEDTAWPQYTPQVSAGHSGWPKGVDSTVNPSEWLWQDPEHVQDPYSFTNTQWINDSDRQLPLATASDSWEKDQLIAEMQKRIRELEKEVEELQIYKRQIQEIQQLVREWK